MAISRAQKKTTVETLQTSLKGAEALVIAHYKGLSVAEMNVLRGRMRQAGIHFLVVKNTLARLALKGTEFESATDMLNGPTSLAFGSDPVAAAKAVNDYAKENEKLVIIGGAFGAQTLDPRAVQALASLPSLDQLRGKIIGLLQAPAQRIACVLQAPGGQVARAIGAYARKE